MWKDLIGEPWTEDRLQLLCISYINNPLHQRINSWCTEYNSCYWTLEGLVSPHLAGCLYLSNEFKGQWLMHEKQGPARDGWATDNLLSFVLKEKWERFKTTWRPRSLMHTFVYSSEKHLLKASHGIRAIWHDHAAIRKTPLKKEKRRKHKGTLHCWSLLVKNMNFGVPQILVQVPPCLSAAD